MVTIKSEKRFFSMGDGHYIICRNCGNTITTAEHIVTVNGEHIHTFTNPAGVLYQIGCFSSADGCIVHGEPTLEHTWFDGFRWSFSICSSCLVHLGWYYQRNDEGFFGLILDRLDTARIH